MHMNFFAFVQESDAGNVDSTIFHLFSRLLERKSNCVFPSVLKNAGLKDTHFALYPLTSTAILIYGNGGSGCAGVGAGFTVWESSDNGCILTLTPQQLLHTHKHGTTWEAACWKLSPSATIEIVLRRWCSHNNRLNKCRNRKSVDNGYIFFFICI